MNSRGKIMVSLAEEKQRNRDIDLSTNLRENPQMILDLPILLIEEDATEVENINIQSDNIVKM
jgi:hypothetical protein